MNFSEDELVAFKEVWSFYADKEKDTIPSFELGTVMRNLGKNPLVSELDAMADSHGKDEIDFESFLDFMEQPLKGGDQPTAIELNDCFSVFDADGTGKIEAQEFRKIMCDIGEALSPKEFDLIMQEANPDPDNTGFVEYKKIIEVLFAKDKKDKD